MKNLLLLSVLFLALAAPAHAMTEESSHYQGSDQRANATDDDDALEQFNDGPRSGYQGQSGREQELLQGNSQSGSQTYGFSGYDNGWTQHSTTGQSGFYYGMR